MSKRAGSTSVRRPWQRAPIAVVIGGPNGAGKSTAAPRLLRGRLGVVEFLNADLIAQGLSPFDPEGAALAASGVLLQRMEALAANRVSFGLESTLAARSLAVRIRDLISRGYEFHLVFLYLSSADVAVARVADRVQHGGHNVPENTIRRRYEAGIRNFFTLYQPIAKSWKVMNNSLVGRMDVIATGSHTEVTQVSQKKLWQQILGEYAR